MALDFFLTSGGISSIHSFYQITFYCIVMKMRALYFGFYDPAYARNRVLIKGLRANGVEVIECRDRSRGLKKFVRLFSKLRSLKKDYDVVIVGFLGHTAVPFAKIFSSKPMIFDAFISLYDSNVFDRKTTKSWSIRSWYYWFLDRLSMSLADVVLFDTNEHINYAVKEFGIARSKFRRIFVGTDDEIFYPREKQENQSFIIHFHGTFIPLQGIECIIRVAKLLEKEEMRFNILGSGQTYPAIKKLTSDLEVKNIDFIDRVEYAKLPEYINQGDICLGIFGRTLKAKRVIPNKIYEYSAMRKPIITADTPAIRELFSENDIYLVPADPEAIASAILKLKNDAKLRESLADNAYNKFKKFATPGILGNQLKKIAAESLK